MRAAARDSKPHRPTRAKLAVLSAATALIASAALGSATALAADDVNNGSPCRPGFGLPPGIGLDDNDEPCFYEVPGGADSGDVINVVDTKPKPVQPPESGPPPDLCPSPILCVPPSPWERPFHDGWGDRQRRQEKEEQKRQLEIRKKKKEGDELYVKCLKERKKYMLPGERPICPRYCPDSGQYVGGLADCPGVKLLENFKPVFDGRWEQYAKILRQCLRLGETREYLKDLRAELEAAGYGEKTWHAHRLDSREILLNTAWSALGCNGMYTPL
jgi:hypothetical protein